ncbi:hypothetical protein [uncultured Kordia sp.]|uniref:hypothetical protein n=1 Tax=uncultured Kordia sp. TaxID=507699 RepID=UPI00261321E7|nr:hypothetical protein [uncultured Kordia sp.]
MNLCILIPLLVGLICAILGYLLGRLFGANTTNNNDDDCLETVKRLEVEVAELQGNIDVYKTEIESLKLQLEACEKSKISLEAKGSADALGVASFAAPAASAILFDAAAAKAVFGKKIKEDDLTIIEGIGPKIKELFHNHDVTTWKGLAETSVEKCQEILNSGGERYKVHNPGTWPRQAKLAYEGKWNELLDWQDILDGGKE